MHHRGRRAVTALTLAAILVGGLLAIRPAEAAPRAFTSPVTGSLTTELVPLPLPIPALATFSGTVDDAARTVTGTLTADPIEFDLDPSTLPIAIEGLPDAPIAFKIKLVTPAPGLSGSWTADGVATLTGNLRIDIGETTIGGIPIGIIGGCYYQTAVQLVGTMNTATGTLDVADTDVVVPGVTGLCAAVLSSLDQYIQGLQFGFSIRADLGVAAATTTTSSTSTTAATTTTTDATTTTEPTTTTTATTTSTTAATTSTTTDSTTTTVSASTTETTEATSTTQPSTTTAGESTTTTDPATVGGAGQARTPSATAATTTSATPTYVG